MSVTEMLRQLAAPTDFLIVCRPTVRLEIVIEDTMEHRREVQGRACRVIPEAPRDKGVSGVR